MQDTRQAFYLEQIASTQKQMQALLEQQPGASSLKALLIAKGQGAFTARQPPVAEQHIHYEKNLWLMTVPLRRVFAPTGLTFDGLSPLFAQKPWAGGLLDDPDAFYRARLDTSYSSASHESLIASMIHSPDRLYAQQLDTFWEGPYSSSNAIHRWRWMADALRTLLIYQAALRFQDETLDATFMALFNRLDRNPGATVLTISLHAANAESASELANVFVVTGKTPASPIQPSTDCGPVALCSNLDGIETFTSLQDLHQALKTRMATPLSRGSLLRCVPWQDHAALERQTEHRFSYTAVSKNIFEHSIKALLTQQKKDLLWCWKTLPKADTDFARLEDAFDRAADIGALLDPEGALKQRARLLMQKNLPAWYATTNAEQQQNLKQLFDEELQHNQALALLFARKKIPSLQAFARQRVQNHLTPGFTELDPDKVTVRIVTTSSSINISGSSTATIGSPEANLPKKADIQYLTLTQFVLRNINPWDFTYMGLLTRTHTEFHAYHAHQQPSDVLFSEAQLRELATALDAGEDYDQLLQRELIDQGAELKAAWQQASLSTLKTHALIAHLGAQSFLPDRLNRGYKWVKALIDHPLPVLRKIENHEIVANCLLIGSTSGARNGYELNNVLVISANSPLPLPNLVLYTPGAPDEQAFKEFSDKAALQCFLKEKWATSEPWKQYFQQRLCTEGKHTLVQKKLAQGALTVFFSAATRRAGNPFDIMHLTPINGHLHQSLYEQFVHTWRNSANSESTTNAEVRQQSLLNQIMFGFELTLDIAGFLPISSLLNQTRHIGRIFLLLAQLKKSRSASLAIWSVTGGGRQILITPTARPPRPLSSLALVPPAPLVPLPAPDRVWVSGNLFRNHSGSEYFLQWGEHYHPSLEIQGRRYLYDPASPAIRYPVERNELTDIWSPVPRERQLRLAGGAPSPALRDPRHTALSTYQLSSAQRNALVSFATERFGILNLADPQLYTSAHRPVHTVIREIWERLDQDALRYFIEFRAPVRPQPVLPYHAQPSALMTQILGQSRGLVIGERHHRSITRRLLIENMHHLKQQGVQTLYLESFLADIHQADLDRFFASPSGEKPSALKTALQQLDFLTSADDAFTFGKLIDAAHTQRIRVIGLDCLGSASGLAVSSVNLNSIQTRMRSMNFHAARLIQADQAAGRWVALVGEAHVNQCLGVPGLAEATGAVGVRVNALDNALSAHAIRDPGVGLYVQTSAYPPRLQCDWLISVPGTPDTLSPALKLHSKGMFTLERSLDGLPNLRYRNASDQLATASITRQGSTYRVDDAGLPAVRQQRFDTLQSLCDTLAQQHQMIHV